MNIETPQRIFKLGSLRLTDPEPSLSPEEAIQLYAANYPQILNATLSEPTVGANGELIYEVQRAPAKTKG